MRRIVKPNEDDTIALSLITDLSKVGLSMGLEKYIVVSKRTHDSTTVVYSRMNDNSFVLAEEYKSVKDLVEFFTMADAYTFKNQQEAYNWLFE
jgi:hypothetical protein